MKTHTLITGASRGLGAALAEDLAIRGWHVVALARTVGWVSQWKEQLADPQLKIGRPRQLYLGSTAKDYVDIENR